MYTIESSTSGATTSSPPAEINPLESSIPLSTEIKITSLLGSESEIVEIEAPKISLPKFIQPKAPQLYTPITLGPSSYLPLSQTETQNI